MRLASLIWMLKKYPDHLNNKENVETPERK